MVNQLSSLGGFPTEVVDDPSLVENILRVHHGFGVRECHEAVQAGFARAALATANSAAGQAGSDFFFGVVEELRNQVARYGYERQRPDGLEVVRRRDNRLQVTTCMATAGAGRVEGSPRPKHEKGASTGRAIHNNQGTLGELAPGSSWDPIETWWLIYEVHVVSGVSRSLTAEVSLPVRMLAGGSFEWARRLILPVLDLNGGSRLRMPDPAPVVEVPLVRRAG